MNDRKIKILTKNSANTTHTPVEETEQENEAKGTRKKIANMDMTSEHQTSTKGWITNSFENYKCQNWDAIDKDQHFNNSTTELKGQEQKNLTITESTTKSNANGDEDNKNKMQATEKDNGLIHQVTAELDKGFTEVSNEENSIEKQIKIYNGQEIQRWW